MADETENKFVPAYLTATAPLDAAGNHYLPIFIPDTVSRVAYPITTEEIPDNLKMVAAQYDWNNRFWMATSDDANTKALTIQKDTINQQKELIEAQSEQINALMKQTASLTQAVTDASEDTTSTTTLSPADLLNQTDTTTTTTVNPADLLNLINKTTTTTTSTTTVDPAELLKQAGGDK